MSHEWTLKFMQHRIADPRILRLIQKWLKAGVSEDGEWSETKVGTPQGAVMTPRTQKITGCHGVRFRVVGRLAGFRTAAVRGGNREAVPDSDGIVAHHYLLGQQAEDFLPFRHVHRLGAGSKPRAKLSQTVHQSQISLLVFGAGSQSVQFGLHCALLFPQRFKPAPQFI
jgi:hypothetical protein